MSVGERIQMHPATEIVGEPADAFDVTADFLSAVSGNAENDRLAEENERLRDALRKLINAAELEEFTEERSDDPLSIAKAALSGREE